MKRLILLAMAMTLASAAAAQSYLENPKYGATPEERESNAKALSFLKDEVQMKNWDFARVYVKQLMNGAPTASVAIYQYGATVYKNMVLRAKNDAEKKAYIDSVMLIYDRRAQHFGTHPTQGAAYILALKARDYANLNAMDRDGVRKYYKEAVAANPKGDVVLEYFQQLVNDYKGNIVMPEELLSEYQRLEQAMAGGTAEDRESLTALFASSGAADCKVLETMFQKELTAKPGDKDVLAKAFALMSAAGCDSDFYASVGEQYYAATPSTNTALQLAAVFEKKELFDKALKYLNEAVAKETDNGQKANLYLRIAASELGNKHSSAAAAAARQAIALDSNNGMARMFIAESLVAGSAGCSGFNRQAVYWLAYDEFSRAREAFAGDAAMQEKMSQRMGACRANFPTKEEGFMSIQGYADGKPYSVSCGWISGGTTIRSR